MPQSNTPLATKKIAKDCDRNQKHCTDRVNRRIADKKTAEHSSQELELQSNQWSATLQNILEHPPAAFPQYLLLGGLVFSLAFTAWAGLGKIEEVGHARGRLEPQGKTYKIHPTEVGKIVQIHVKEGEKVKRGELLFELDAQIENNAVRQLQQKLMSHQEELKQKQALVENVKREAQTNIKLSQANLQIQRNLIAAALVKVTTNRALLAKMQAERVANQTRLNRLSLLTGVAKEQQKQLKLDVVAHQERVNRLKQLVADGAISKEYLFQAEQLLRDRTTAIAQVQLQEGASADEYLFNAQQTWRDRNSAIIQQQGDLKQSLTEIQSLRSQLQQKQVEASIQQQESQQRIEQLQMETTQLNAKIAETQSLLKTAKAKLVEKFLYAPVDGVVSSLNVSNVGEFLQQGQTIAEIAPQSAPLVLMADLPDREAGLVKLGMPVQVKFDAFPYQDYGIVTGKITSISPDTQPDTQQQAVYKVEIALDRHEAIAHRQILLKAGQTATADIIIRRRRIAEVLLEPFEKMQKGGMNL